MEKSYWILQSSPRWEPRDSQMKYFQQFFHVMVEKKQDLQHFSSESVLKSRSGFSTKMFSWYLPQFSFYQMLKTAVQPPAQSRASYEVAVQMQGNANTSCECSVGKRGFLNQQRQRRALFLLQKKRCHQSLLESSVPMEEANE